MKTKTMELSLSLNRSYTPFAFYVREFQRRNLTIGLGIGLMIFLATFISYHLSPYLWGDETYIKRQPVDITINLDTPPPPLQLDKSVAEKSGDGDMQGSEGFNNGQGDAQQASATLEQELAFASDNRLFADVGIGTNLMASNDPNAGNGESTFGNLSGGGLRVDANGVGLESKRGGLGDAMFAQTGGTSTSGIVIGGGKTELGSGTGTSGIGTAVTALSIHVKQGKAELSDDESGRSASEIERLLASKERALSECYEPFKKADPTLKASVEISFVIRPDGLVGGVQVSSSFKNEKFIQALVSKFRTFKFSPLPDGKPQTIVYPVVFD
jgi:TonB family protein